VAKSADIHTIMTTFKRLVALPLGRILLALCLCAAASSALAGTLRLDDRAIVDVWPAVTVLVDPDGALGVEEVALLSDHFETPTGVAGNLGRRAETIWLRAKFVVSEDTPDTRHVLAIDYPALNKIDLYLLRNGRVQSRHRMGNQLQQDERAMQVRAHAAPLPAAPGEYELLLRVSTLSSMVLPITIRTQEGFQGYESKVHLVQGIFLGLTLCMLLYSLAHWVSLRDLVFLDYALLLVGNAMFSLSYFGIGAQYVWTDLPRVSALIAPMGIMIAVAAGTRFIRVTLAVHKVSRSVDLILRVAGVSAVLGLAGTLVGLIEYRSAQTLVTVLGILVTFIVLPVAAIHTYRGERDAAYILFGWSFYSVGAIAASGILRGLVEPTFLAQHTYPFTIMIEMSAWMAVLGRRVKTIHSNADRARLESETLRTMANSDVLTGLPNRRGLNDHLSAMLRDASPENMCAVYLMDLDGFKSVNDRYGHDVGDALLVAVGKRLRSQLRNQDVVSRLGGDEFVVLIGGLSSEAVAHSMGHKLLVAFSEPFEIADQRCEVGLTIGYALAPLDGNAADDLLKRADAAMYNGKQQGRSCVQRGGRAMVSLATETTPSFTA